MVDSYMIATNYDNVDLQSNFTGPNLAAEKLAHDANQTKGKNMTLATLEQAYRAAQSVSRKYQRAERALALAIKDLQGAGFNTVELEANLEAIQESRGLARVKRALAYDAWIDAARKKIQELEDAQALANTQKRAEETGFENSAVNLDDGDYSHNLI